MTNPAMIVLMCIFIVATGGVAGFSLFFALNSLFPTVDTTRPGKIERYCQAVEAWESRQEELDGIAFHLRHQSQEVRCHLSSVPNQHDLDVKTRSDAQCSAYRVKVVRCNVSELMLLPVIDAKYTLELLGQRSGSDTLESLGEVVIQVFTDRMWDLLGNKNTECRKDAGCLAQSRQAECKELRGTLVDKDATRCLIHHRLIPAVDAFAPCWVINTGGSAAGAPLKLWDLGWRANMGNQSSCTKPPLGEKRLQHMTGTWMKGFTSNLQAIKSILEESQLTFRHQEDPYVVASKLTDSTFDMGPSQTEMAVFGSLMMVVAVCAAGCCIGLCFSVSWIASKSP